MTIFRLDTIAIDPVAYGSQGSAILGIKDSGKSYTATFLAERLFEHGIPFVAFDPIGVWRFLRVPRSGSDGKGYPVVVAGGEDGDLPLTIAGAPEIIRAAMRNNVSLVIDLFDINLSRADWRRIVTSCIRVLLHENRPFGLRHVFLEEAAEFIPQRPTDPVVYAEVEKLARMGGNSRLGYTLINQRSQEVAKAVLELCENVFLHRQRGKNALENLDKWLAVAEVKDQRRIIASLPDLPQGQCWAWIGGDKPKPPALITVPMKNSLHPDRRVRHEDHAIKNASAVNVGAFVQQMLATLEAVVKEAEANDPVMLRRQIVELRKQVSGAASPFDKAYVAEEYNRGSREGYIAAYSEMSENVKEAFQKAFAAVRAAEAASDMMSSVVEIANRCMQGKFPASPPPLPPGYVPIAITVSDSGKMPAPLAKMPGPQQRILDAWAWWNSIGENCPTRVQIAVVGSFRSAAGSNFRNPLYKLHADGHLRYPSSDTVTLTQSGLELANHPAIPASSGELHHKIFDVLKAPEQRIMAPLLNSYPHALPREQLAKSGKFASAGSSNFRNPLYKLHSLGLIEYHEQSSVSARSILFID